MYSSYYGMSCNPFLSDNNILYKSRDYQECYSRLNYLKEVRGLGVILGDPGLGKTYILNAFIESLNKDLYKIIYLTAKDDYNLFEFYKELANQLNISVGACYKCDLYKNIQNEIQRLVKHQRIEPIIIIDDAHCISNEILLNLKILLDFDEDQKDYTTLILCGCPELKERLIKKNYETIYQRIIVNYQLHGLSREEVKEYVETRFKIANITTPIFTATALNALYNVSKAIPRRLNNLILNCLMLGYQNKKQLLDEEIVRNAKNELDL